MKRLRRRKGENLRGLFSKVMTGLKFLVLINAMIFVSKLLFYFVPRTREIEVQIGAKILKWIF